MEKNSSENFTELQKKAIFKRDDHRCVFCGFGTREGLKIYAVPILAKLCKGKPEIINGQTLCSRHKGMTIKQMFASLCESAKEQNDKTMQSFCSQIIKVFGKHKANDRT